MIVVPWGSLIERAGARPEDAACCWSDKRNPCPVSPHQGIAPCRMVRVNARWGGRHHALAPLPPAFDQRHRLCAAIGRHAHKAPGEDCTRGPLDAEVAIVASTPGGLLAGQVLQQEPHASGGQPRHEARVDLGIVKIQELQPCPPAIGQRDAAHGTADDAETHQLRAGEPALHLSRGGVHVLIALPPNEPTVSSPGVHDARRFAAWCNRHHGAARREIGECRGSEQRGGRTGKPTKSCRRAFRR
jgi:hypothetical protein